MTGLPALSDALEVIALSVEDGIAAQAGGATRLEVVRDILADGLTPDVRLVEALLARVGIPLRVMIRPRNTFLVADQAHRQEIARDALLFADLPVDVVTGYIRSTADAQALADRRLQAASREYVHVTFDSLPVPFLTVGDMCAVQTARTVVPTFRLSEYSLPLGHDGAMSIGTRRRVHELNRRRWR